MLFSSVHPAPRGQAALDRQEGFRQSLAPGKRTRQMQRMLLHRLCRLCEAAVRIGPTTDQEHPMLDEHGQELGIHFTQDTPRLGAPGLIDAAMALPQWLLLDSRGVDLPMSYDPIVVTLSSLKPFFFNGLQ
jgi:hypothetical protein